MAADPDLLELDGAFGSGVSRPAVVAYARWWEIEDYLREVVYTELRSAFGDRWTEELGGDVPSRAERDRINSYMASPDDEDLLCYADTSVLFKMIKNHWSLFAEVLLPEARWQGTADTLLAIRHRVAHCRRPHRDDLYRLGQALRDLEPGARIFYGSHARTIDPRSGRKDPLLRAWLHQRHEAASRLIDHCERKYDIHFRLGYSARPWVGASAEDARISGRPGFIWHAQWLLGSRELRPYELWRSLPSDTQDRLMHLLVDPFSATATFSAIDDPDGTADAIGIVFEALIPASRPGLDVTQGLDTERPESLRKEAAELPSKVEYNGPFSLFDPLNPEAFTLFSA